MNEFKVYSDVLSLHT